MEKEWVPGLIILLLLLGEVEHFFPLPLPLKKALYKDPDQYSKMSIR